MVDRKLETHRGSGWVITPHGPPGESGLGLRGDEGHFRALTSLSEGQGTWGKEGSIGKQSRGLRRGPHAKGVYLTISLSPMSLAEAAAAPTAAPGPAQPGHVSPTPATTSPGEKGEAGTPVPAGTTAAAIPRRHAPLEQLVRQGSFRGFPALSQKNSPFKRQLSLRLNELPSTLQRRTDFQVKGTGEPRTQQEGTLGSMF